MTLHGVPYVLLIGLTLCLLAEIKNGVGAWWIDVKLRREIRKRGNHLRAGWSSEGVARTREKLKDARQTRADLEVAALDASLAAKGQRRGTA